MSHIINNIKIKIVDSRINNEFTLPFYATAGSAGMDLVACIDKELIMSPDQCELIPSGVAIYIENPSFAGFLYPRSGLGHKHGIILGNGVGVIDSDYQGEIKISCLNRSNKPYTISPGDRIAQLVIAPVVQVRLDLVSSFEGTHRNDKGFGSTGNSCINSVEH